MSDLIKYLDRAVIPGIPGSGRVDTVKDPVTDTHVPAVFSSAQGARDLPYLIDRTMLLRGASGRGKSFAVAAPSAGHRAIDLFTTLILDGNQSTRPDILVNRFFPSTTPTTEGGNELVEGLSFWRPIFGTQHLREIDTRLPERAPYPIIDTDVSFVSDSLESFGLASTLTDKEARSAHPSLDWPARKRRLPAQGIRIAQAHQAWDILSDLTPGNTYNAGGVGVLTLAAGDEWDDATPGDPLEDLNTGINAVSDSAAVPRSAIEIAITDKALNAAIGNAAISVFFDGTGALALNGQSIDYRRQVLANILGVRAVWPLEFVGVNASGVWGRQTDDECIIWTNGEGLGEEYDTTDGVQRWTANFSVTGFVAVADIDMPWIRTVGFPVLAEYALRVLDPANAFIITNCSAV